VVLSAQGARQMISGKMIKEHKVIEKELLTEVTIRMRQYFAKPFIANVTELNVLAQSFDVV
jgi:hypothetical protein